MTRSNSSDDNNGSFAPMRPGLHETEPGFESVDVGAEATEEDGHYRRKPGGVPEPPHQSLAERIRTSESS
jgi:hypothetical protein